MLLSLYHMMPPPVRSFAATVRGWQLKQWRFGRETEQLVAETLERDQWTPEQWRRWEQARLEFVLHRAATRVPFYRQHWAERRRKGDRSTWELLHNWPVLGKDTLRKHARTLVADDCDTRRMFHEHTSGTTGKPLDLWWSRSVVRSWYAIMEARCRRWFGLSLNDNWAILGGQLVAPFSQRKPPFWVWNAALNQLYCSSYHLAPDFVPHYLSALEKHGVQYLLGYPSSLAALAQGALQTNRFITMRVAITNAEPVYDHQRAAISKAFGCPVIETYGMAEIVAGASQCDHGRLHSWPEIGRLDVDRSSTAAEAASLECTSLLNADMPLIRYLVGDLLEPSGPDTPCACGRRLPAFGRVHGRADDVLYTVDGRAIGRLDPIFKNDLPVHEAQIIQEDYDSVRILYVPTRDYTSRAGHELTGRLQARMGPVCVTLEPVKEISRSASGKFQAAVCAIPKERMRAMRGADS